MKRPLNVLNRVVMTTCCLTSVFLKNFTHKISCWQLDVQIMTSEGWTLVNFKMFSAKACMNRVFSTEAFIKRGFLKPFVLNHVAIRMFCFTRIVLIFLKTRCFIKKSRQSHELEPKHPPLHNFVLRRSSFKRSCCLSKASASPSQLFLYVVRGLV